MKTLSVTEGRQNLGHWLKESLRGVDVGILVDGKVVALRPVEIYSADYALQEYGVSEAQLDRAYEAARKDVRAAQRAGKITQFTGKL